MSLQCIASMHRFNGLAPAQLCEAFPPHTLGEMYSALAYYYDHKDEIDREIDLDDREFEDG